MFKTIILRFRDILADSFAEHTKIIQTGGNGYVWWGWWRKPNEPTRISELAELKARTLTKTLEIGLYDRSRPAFFSATIGGCVFSEVGEFIETPEELKTPAYYRNAKVPAWLKLLDIKQITQEEFVKKFGEPPLDEYTLFLVEQPVSLTGGVAGRKRGGAKGSQPKRPKAKQPGVKRPSPKSTAGAVIKLSGSVIVHLSDLHFGSDHGYPATGGPGAFPLLQILSDDIKKQVGNNIGLLVVSGDTTSRGDAGSLFNTAVPFLNDLCRQISLEPARVVIVPGNHDISLKDFVLTYDHERAFNKFIADFYGEERQLVNLSKFELPSGRPLEVLSLHSVKLRTKEFINYGWVDWTACETLLEKQPRPADNVLRLAVIHHHLVPALREERLPDQSYPYASASVTLNAPAIIEGLQRHGFKVVLHGHQHTPAVNVITRGRLKDGTLELDGLDERLYVLAGGSTGVSLSRIDSDIRDNTYSIIQIEEDKLRLRVRQFNPSGALRDFYSATLPLD